MLETAEHFRLPMKLICDHLGDDQPKTDSLSVHRTSRLQAPEQFEELRLIQVFDANSVVEYAKHDLVRVSFFE